MTEAEAVAYIENYTWSTTRLGLERTRELLFRLGDPQKALRFVHVAGSNGKGSTCAMLASVLTAAGYQTGLYTSPHIQNFRERFQINGVPVSGARFAAVTERVRSAAEEMADHPSQFELSTAIAMLCFLAEGCDIVVLEVGLGGALDSTNAIDAPEVAVITNLGLEHTEYLGNTIEEIAAAKAGIIKPGCEVVCYDGAEEVTRVVQRVCREKGAILYPADFSQLEPLSRSLDGQEFLWRGRRFRIPLLGRHQLYNAAVALEAVQALRYRGWSIRAGAAQLGLARVRWPARFEVLAREPVFILDGGHNPQCAQALAGCLADYLPGEKVNIVMGVLADKDYAAILDTITPCAASFLCLTPDSPRALPAQQLAEELRRRGFEAEAFADTGEALKKALELGRPTVAFGSLYMAGAIRETFIPMYRKWLRKRKIKARDSLSKEEREELSARLVENLVATPEFQNAKTVLIYRATRGEVRLETLESAPESRGKTLAFPLCVSDTEMIALVPHGEDAWADGYYGIREPVREKSDLVPPEDIDLVVCPCTAFDEKCSRMGMGAGFYDRYLEKCVNAEIVSVAFECQKAVRIPTAPWDKAVGLTVTERQVYHADEP